MIWRQDRQQLLCGAIPHIGGPILLRDADAQPGPGFAGLRGAGIGIGGEETEKGAIDRHDWSPSMTKSKSGTSNKPAGNASFELCFLHKASRVASGRSSNSIQRLVPGARAK